jgi:hypothetical protein
MVANIRLLNLQRRHLPDPLKFCPHGPTGPTVSCISVTVLYLKISWHQLEIWWSHEGSLIIVNKVKSRKQIGKNFCSFLFMLNFGNQFPFRILFRILSVIVVNCNLIISYDQNQIKDIAKGGLVTETTFNLVSPATSNNQYFILVRFYYSSNEYFDIKSSFVCSFCPSIFE